MTEKMTLASIAKWKVNDVAYWVHSITKFEDCDIEIPEWVSNHHQKVLVDTKIVRKPWWSSARPPRVSNGDFGMLMMIFEHTFVADRFVVKSFWRSPETGEMYYVNTNNDEMPESFLFETMQAARIERDRVLRMVIKWTTNNL